jgi:diketogulonate reductase-like aldo/keto reductase
MNNNIKIVAHSPLAKGELFYKQELKDISHIYNVSPAQLMLKWGIQKGYRVIPRSKDCKHIEENINLDFTINDIYMTVLNHLDCGYSTHPKYLTPIEKKIFKKLRAEYKRKRRMKVNFI